MAEPTTAPEASPPAVVDRGRTTISERVVPKIAAVAASEVEGALHGRRGWTGLVRKGLPRTDAQVAGGTSRIRVQVAATWGTPLAEMAARVRDHVAARVTELSGYDVAAVDVSVTDLVDVDETHRSR